MTRVLLNVRGGIAIIALILVSACATQEEPPMVLSKKSAVELRAMQSRVFETGDTGKVYRSVIAVLLDQGYAIKSLEPDAGTISGNKLAQLDLSVSVAAVDPTRTNVRANATVKLGPGKQFPRNQVDSPEFYQMRFFEPLSKALFLEAMYEE